MAQTGNDRTLQMVARYTDGASMGTIASEFGISRQRVHQILSKAGVAGRPSRLAPAVEDEIVRLYEHEGVRAVAIARELDVHLSTVYKVLARRRVPA